MYGVVCLPSCMTHTQGEGQTNAEWLEWDVQVSYIYGFDGKIGFRRGILTVEVFTSLILPMDAPYGTLGIFLEAFEPFPSLS